MNGLTNMFSDFEKSEKEDRVVGMMTEAAIMRDIRDTHLATISSSEEAGPEPSFSLEGAEFTDLIDPVMEAELNVDDLADECGMACSEDDTIDIDDVDTDYIPDGDEDETAAVMDECSESTADSILAKYGDVIG